MRISDWSSDVCSSDLFRLPGIYGPGRSALDRVRKGEAHRIEMPKHVFSRLYVDDIISGVIASFRAPPGVYNIADDYPCSQNEVIEFACTLLDMPYPRLEAKSEERRVGEDCDSK